MSETISVQLRERDCEILRAFSFWWGKAMCVVGFYSIFLIFWEKVVHYPALQCKFNLVNIHYSYLVNLEGSGQSNFFSMYKLK